MQPGPDSIGIVAISHGCTGVAGQACGLVGLEPAKVSKITRFPYSLLFRFICAHETLNGHTASRLQKSYC